jgi:hypothetical protein
VHGDEFGYSDRSQQSVEVCQMSRYTCTYLNDCKCIAVVSGVCMTAVDCPDILHVHRNAVGICTVKSRKQYYGCFPKSDL